MATMPMPSLPIQIACGGIGAMAQYGITRIGVGTTIIGIIHIMLGILITILIGIIPTISIQAM